MMCDADWPALIKPGLSFTNSDQKTWELPPRHPQPANDVCSGTTTLQLDL